MPLAADIVDAVADNLTTTARTIPVEHTQPLVRAAELLYRATGQRRLSPWAVPDVPAVQLRSFARLIGLIGQLGADGDVGATWQLVDVIAGFADNLATLRRTQRRRSQAAAAATAAIHLHTIALLQLRPPAAPGPSLVPPETPSPANRRAW